MMHIKIRCDKLVKVMDKVTVFLSMEININTLYSQNLELIEIRNVKQTLSFYIKRTLTH